MTQHCPIPVIDLFAGPGGLGEGFSSWVNDDGERSFAVRLSIEKDPVAHKTLSLRALFRAFPSGSVPNCYYDHVRGAITREVLFAHPDASDAGQQAISEARCAELGVTPLHTVDGWIRTALGNATEWALIGGPPCQAYSLAGRARMRQKQPEAFESDRRHLLYKEYLRVIREFGPSVFVMENVKGMLNSQHKGSPIFDSILSDLTSPGNGLSYQVRSLVVDKRNPDSNDFVIQAENYGVPQKRHRVILFGIRSDLAEMSGHVKDETSRFILIPSKKQVSVNEALSGLPPLRSRLSKEPDSHANWLAVLRTAISALNDWNAPSKMMIEEAMKSAATSAASHVSVGSPFVEKTVVMHDTVPPDLQKWLHDPKLGGVLQHETRSHMRSDIHRYLFASCFARHNHHSPKLGLYPPNLQPDHRNAIAEHVPFIDRFRVQLGNEPATTVVSHIAKDGHYYIHPDPAQCRSLTVREAARLQTFPDNYFFAGNRTEQYTQIGNAVPPYLARQIAEVVRHLILSSRR